MQDPFFAVKEEVEHSVTVVTQLHGKWKELLKSKAKGDEQEWTTSELLSGLRSIEWDLQDLEDTVSIVEGNRQKFQLEDGDVQERKDFIESVRQKITAMRDEVQGTAATEPGGYSTKSSAPKILGSSKKGGFGKLATTEDPEAGVSLTQMASDANDEILGMESAEPAGRQPRRHVGKKLCVCAIVIAIIVAIIMGVAAAGGGGGRRLRALEAVAAAAAGGARRALAAAVDDAMQVRRDSLALAPPPHAATPDDEQFF